jgi:catechol 2,3-dioxygenase-like lactoylglutathione lyase family enzyme
LASRDFYAGTLGLETRLDVAMRDGRRWMEVTPPGAATTVALVSASQGGPSWVETGIRFSTPDAEAAHADLTAAGVDVDEVLRGPAVPAMFAFRDPDGNGLEIVEERAAQP